MTPRQLPQEILEAFIDKMLSENVSDFHSFSEDYKDGDYVWTLEAQVYLPSDFRFEVKYTSITCWDEVNEEEVECSNYHSYELADIIEERCFPYWTESLKEAWEIKETEGYLQWKSRCW